jgi:hypothetical protein
VRRVCFKGIIRQKDWTFLRRLSFLGMDERPSLLHRQKQRGVSRIFSCDFHEDFFVATP